MAQGENNNVIGAIAIGAIAFFLWRLFSRKSNVIVSSEPAKEDINEQLKGQELICENIIYKPLSGYGPFAANLLGKGWCYKGDGSFFDNQGLNTVFGDKFADEQAQSFSEAKQIESVRAINKKVIQFRLINSTAAPVTTEILDTAKTATPAFSPIPDAPVASAATGVTSSGFTANWALSAGATGYYLDVATDNAFASFVSGYQNLDVSNVLTKAITGLNELTSYYYRIRAYNSTGTSSSSNTITTTTLQKTFSDYFLPSKDELNQMYVNLYLFGVGNFGIHEFWSSSEPGFGLAVSQAFADGTQYNTVKTNHINYYTRACRSFTSATVYALREIGPAGGLIFYKNGNDYLEASPANLSIDYVWSNIMAVIGTTGTAIGTGQANTNAIIAQAGHIDSAAKLCDDLIVTN